MFMMLYRIIIFFSLSAFSQSMEFSGKPRIPSPEVYNCIDAKPQMNHRFSLHCSFTFIIQMTIIIKYIYTIFHLNVECDYILLNELDNCHPRATLIIILYSNWNQFVRIQLHHSHCCCLKRFLLFITENGEYEKPSNHFTIFYSPYLHTDDRN